MNEENENLSLYLHRVEASARKILRKNNELRSRQAQKQMRSTSSGPWQFGRLKVQTKTNTKANKDVTFDKTDFRSGKEIVKSKNIAKSNESMKNQSWKDPKSENDIDMDITAAFLRKRYRSDENLVESEQSTQIKESIEEHPLKLLLIQHVEAIRTRVTKMTEKRLSSFAQEVYNDCVKLLDAIKSEIAKEKENSCDDKTEIVRAMDDLCDDSNQEVLHEIQNGSCLSHFSPRPSSRLIPCLPPQRWTLATLEPMTPWNELYFVSIYRYYPNNQAQRAMTLASIPLFVIDFYGKNKNHVSRYILNEQDVADLCNPEKVVSLDYRELGVVYTTPFDIKVKNDNVASPITGTLEVKVIRACNNHMCKLLAKITSSLYQDDTCVKNSSIEVPMNVVIAALDLFYLAVSSDEKFWTDSENNATIWPQFLKFVQVHMEMDEIELTLRVPEENSAIETINWSGSCRDISKLEFINALSASRNIISHLATPPASSCIFLENLYEKAKVEQSSKLNLIQEMEKQRQLVPSLSVRLSGPLALSEDLIPGVCSMPFPLNWDVFGNNSSELADATEVAFTFNRETPDSPLSVTTRVAFQYPIEAPKFKIFDKKQMIPKYATYEPVQGPIPLITSKAKSILTEELESLVDDRCPGPVTLIDVAALDQTKRTLLNKFPKESNEETSEFFSEYGFRTKVATEEFLEKEPFPLHTFGITEDGLSPNEPITSERTFLRSTEVCDYLLSEERGSKDFMHMIQNPYSDKDGGYPNDPMISIIHMNGYQVGRVEGIKMTEYLKREEKMIQEQEEKKKKDILTLKMKAADRLLKARLPHVYDGVDSSLSTDKSQSTLPSSPTTIHDGSLKTDFSEHEQSYTWRNLDEKLPEGIDLFDMASYKLPTYGKSSALNKLFTPIVCDIVKPSEGIDYVLDHDIFKTAPTTLFIKDLLEDRFQMSHKKQKEERSRDIILNAEQEIALDHIIRVPLEAKDSTMGKTSILLESSSDIDRAKAVPTKTVDNDIMSNEVKAILATRHADFDKLEYLLDEIGVDTDTHDEHGNTLLIIAAQQGNKKLCKFLLRRGAYINAQNHHGNTVLHYLYEYGHVNLAEYLIQKGADDSFLNGEGLTCFEGTSRTKLDDL